MEGNLTKEDIIKVFFDYRKSITDVRDDMNRSYLEYKIDNIKQRRELFKYITGVSLAVIGLTPFILNYSNSVFYTITAVFLHSTVILYVILYFREILDKESNELQKQQDGYNFVTDEVLEIVDKYIDAKNYDVNSVVSFLGEIQASNGASKLKKDLEDLKKERENREEQLDYSGELITFLFILGSFFLILGSLSFRINNFVLILICILIFGLSFSDYVLNTSVKISKAVLFLKKKRLHF